MPGGFGFTGNTFKRILKNSIKYNNNAQTDRASGGSSIANNNRYLHSLVNLKKSSSSCHSSVSLQNNYYLLYILSISLQDIKLSELFQQPPAPLMITGDFNALNP